MQILLEFVRKISKRIKGGVSKMNNFKNMKLKNKIMIPIVILVFLILSVIIAGMSVILYNSKSQDKQKEIRESAKNYGLEISSEIENSFEKARAAASMLPVPSWPSARAPQFAPCPWMPKGTGSVRYSSM